VYESDVIIDSGATEHMTGDLSHLDNQYPYYTSVTTADGSMCETTTAGIMRVQCECTVSKTIYNILLLNTLYVPNFRVNLWSVASFNASGHVMVFTCKSVHVIMHQGTPSEFTIYVRHPYHRTPKGIERVPQYAHMARAIPIQPLSVPPTQIPYQQSIIRKDPPKKKVLLELLHRRLGHATMKTLLAADAANMFNDIKIEFEPTSPCLDCQITTIHARNIGKKPVGESTTPGQVWFLDIIQNRHAKDLPHQRTSRTI
jgi:hypothetical protein